jgi:hypothetical protein
MPEPIVLPDQKEDYIQLVCLYTKLQYSSAPTTYLEVIESALNRDFINLERELMNHPLTNIHMYFAILVRVAWAQAVLHGFADPEIKHKTLLQLRDSFRMIQRLPEAWRDAFAPIWAHWLEVLNEEEECLGSA